MSNRLGILTYVTVMVAVGFAVATGNPLSALGGLLLMGPIWILVLARQPPRARPG